LCVCVCVCGHTLVQLSNVRQSTHIWGASERKKSTERGMEERERERESERERERERERGRARAHEREKLLTRTFRAPNAFWWERTKSRDFATLL